MRNTMFGIVCCMFCTLMSSSNADVNNELSLIVESIKRHPESLPETLNNILKSARDGVEACTEIQENVKLQLNNKEIMKQLQNNSELKLQAMVNISQGANTIKSELQSVIDIISQNASTPTDDQLKKMLEHIVFTCSAYDRVSRGLRDVGATYFTKNTGEVMNRTNLLSKLNEAVDEIITASGLQTGAGDDLNKIMGLKSGEGDVYVPAFSNNPQLRNADIPEKILNLKEENVQALKKDEKTKSRFGDFFRKKGK